MLPELKSLICGDFTGFVLVHLCLKPSIDLTVMIDMFNDVQHDLPIKVNIRKSRVFFFSQLTRKNFPTEGAKYLSSKVHILYWILTHPKNLEKKTKHGQATWAKTLLYMSWNISDFPPFGLNLSEGRDHLHWKTIWALESIHTLHLDVAECFLKANDDTFVMWRVYGIAWADMALTWLSFWDTVSGCFWSRAIWAAQSAVS